MKSHPSILLLAAVACCLVLTATATTAAPGRTPIAASPSADDTADASDPWSTIKRYTYDERELFAAGAQELATRVDAQVAELEARRAEMNASNTRTKEWDFAMEEMKRARTNLISTSHDTTKATRDNWDQLKDQVGLAWVRTQDAYTKVKASTTN
jgi:hypothetical protein